MSPPRTQTIEEYQARRRETGPGARVRLELPFSEVCMHMRVAGTVMTVEIRESGCACGHASSVHHEPDDSLKGRMRGACLSCASHYPSSPCTHYRMRCVAQILNPDGTPFSAPIGLGEAGIYVGVDYELYYYAPREAA